MSRSAVFLDEMGIGPLWRLRQGAAPELQEVIEAAPEPIVPVVQAMPEIARVVEVAETVPPPAVVAPAAVPPAPVALPVAEDTAWFDDAPAPPAAQPVTDAEIAAMDWDSLAGAVAKCTRCDLCKSRKGVVMGRGNRQADWLMLASSPSRLEEREQRALPGDQGKLLDNMLKAIDLDTGRDTYVTHLLKCRPLDEAGQERLPTQAESAACRPYFERELALLQPRTIVTLGSMAAAGMMPTEKPVRGKVRQLGAMSLIATFHPEALLQDDTGRAKARAWADLCLAKSTHG
ncbi:uracil-DNA glycosylase [Janthinobacterium aquaticum]|uniref:uracil-DNA glycosylase n=1 Tax=Janthinobacterium sp. FT58W TaxID=2654254 RepID=UPI0012642024|nr:uracil-DNA glycosylase [Janthinobacterium sp. FT58W]KAB8045348.1 uracil-DNA glycosylase [Janthinobacterium sp. FT58W]